MTVKLKTPSNGSVSLTPQDTAADVVLTVPSTQGSQLAVADSSGYTYSGGLVVSPQTGFKNRIINGGMTIDQRNAGASVTNSTGLIYTLDRWAVQTVGSSCSIQQVAGSTGNNKALRVTGATGNSNTLVSQKIEAANIYDCAGQTVTVSFTIYGSGSGTISVRFLYPTATDNFASTTEPVAGTAVNFTTTATTYTVTRTLDANANKGLWLVFERGATGAGVTYSLENVQLEKGSVATPFEFRSYGQELALCQRYYEVGNFHIRNDYRSDLAAAFGAGGNFLVSKRDVPSITVLSNAGSAGTTSQAVSPVSVTFYRVSATGSATTGGQIGQIFQGSFSASAEL